jgi:hypothetical protein
MQEVHHLTYDRLGHEDPADLIGLCRACHSFLHGRSNYDPLRVGRWIWRLQLAVLFLLLLFGLSFLLETL